LARAREGDVLARERLFRRHYPTLRRLAHGRLPQRSRPEKDTDDIVQLTMLRATRGFDHFEARWDGAWLAYLRQILFNCLRDEYRRSARQPDPEALEAAMGSVEASPLDGIIETEALSAYQKALKSLSAVQQEAVILRVEQGLSYARIGQELGSPSPDAARMIVKRAIARLTTMIGGGHASGA